MPTGTILRLVSERGYGFLQPTDAETQIFFHRTALEPGEFERLRPGTTVSYQLQADPRGRGPQAVQLRVAAPAGTSPVQE